MNYTALNTTSVYCYRLVYLSKFGVYLLDTANVCRRRVRLMTRKIHPVYLIVQQTQYVYSFVFTDSDPLTIVL